MASSRVALFSGALRYTQYGFLKRHMMKKIASGSPATSDGRVATTCLGMGRREAVRRGLPRRG